MKTSAVKITKKEFNATLVAERTAQIACCNGKVNRLNDIVAVLNDTEKMQNVKDNAEWRTVTKTRANGVMFSNGSTLDYKANAEYYRVGNVIIVVNVSEIEDFDAAYNRVNVPYYNVMAYLIDAPELETPTKTDTTMKVNNTSKVTETKVMKEVTVTISPDGSDLYAATVNGVTVGSVNTWFNNTFAASYNFGINTRKRLAMPELNNVQDAAHGFITEVNAVLWLGDMIKRYFAEYGIIVNIVNA